MPLAPMRLLCIMLLVALAGCDPAAERSSSDVAADAPNESAAAAKQGQADRDTEHAQSPEHASSNEEAMPLLPIMMRLGVDMAGFMHALWAEDYEAMTRHAVGVSAHPNISTDELERIASILGTETEAFEVADEEVHQASVRMREAAEARDMDAVLEHLAAVQSGCVGCHNRFRERLRTNR